MAPLRSTLGRSLGRLLKVGRTEDLAGTGAQGGAALGTQLNSQFYGGREGGVAAASGGLEVESPTHKYHVFTSSDTLTVNVTIPSMDIVVVGGGGGGYPGNPAGGGAGGGGVFIKTLSSVATPLIATIGEGGDPSPNTVGEASILATPTAPTAYVAPGGDRVGSPNAGGDSYPGPIGPSSGPELFQSGAGGSASGDTGGAGGGAGGPGGNGVGGPGCSSTGATGGDGYPAPNFPGPIFAPIMPTDFVSALGPTGLFGGGGGGAIRCSPGGANTPGPGGPGGGGRGGAEPNHPGGGDPGRNGGSGVANTGGGGGGAHSYGGTGGAGGDGVVICRYAI